IQYLHSEISSLKLEKEKLGKTLLAAKKEIEKLNPRKSNISKRINELEDQLRRLQVKIHYD
ncbi:unnamed protein product, partial [Allacma fusca]